MKRQYRLRRPAHFQRVRRGGRSWETSLIVLQATPNRTSQTRCGFVVSRRIGSAVARNRAKRRTREAVRLVYMHIDRGWDLVFIIRSPGVIDIDFPQLQASVERVLRRANIWHPPAPDTSPR